VRIAFVRISGIFVLFASSLLAGAIKAFLDFKPDAEWILENGSLVLMGEIYTSRSYPYYAALYPSPPAVGDRDGSWNIRYSCLVTSSQTEVNVLIICEPLHPVYLRS